MEKPIPQPYQDLFIPVVVSEYKTSAWQRTVILYFLRDPACSQFAILGGDVLRFDKKNSEYVYTYDNWYVSSRNKGENFANYCQRSREVALEYIQNYPIKPNTVFVPVMTSEVTAGL